MIRWGRLSPVKGALLIVVVMDNCKDLVYLSHCERRQRRWFSSGKKQQQTVHDHTNLCINESIRGRFGLFFFSGRGTRTREVNVARHGHTFRRRTGNCLKIYWGRLYYEEVGGTD